MPKSLAEIVIEEGLATAASIELAAEAADRTSVPLVVALVRQSNIDEVALVAALRRHARVPLGDPATVAADPDAVREISRDVCERLTAAPLSLSTYDGRNRALKVAMADPTDAVALAELEHVTGCRIEPVLMTVSAVEELIDKTYRHFVTEVMKKREPVPARAKTAPLGSVTGQAAIAGKLSSRFVGGPRTDDGVVAHPVDGPTTVPYHRLSDEADVEMRVRALLSLLIAKRVISEDELEEEVRQLMRRQDSDQ